MSDLNLISIAIGVMGALVGVYFRESFRRAVRQKTLASKLGAQMRGTITGLRRSDVGQILVLGEVWRRESTQALLEKGSKAFVAVEQKWEAMLKEAKATVEKGNRDADEALIRLHECYRKMPEKLFSYHLQQFEAVRDSLLSSRGFISEDESSEISWDTVSRVVSARTLFLRVLHLNMVLILTFR
jgi:hypothetical protein